MCWAGSAHTTIRYVANADQIQGGIRAGRLAAQTEGKPGLAYRSGTMVNAAVHDCAKAGGRRPTAFAWDEDSGAPTLFFPRPDGPISLLTHQPSPPRSSRSLARVTGWQGGWASLSLLPTQSGGTTGSPWQGRPTLPDWQSALKIGVAKITPAVPEPSYGITILERSNEYAVAAGYRKA